MKSRRIEVIKLIFEDKTTDQIIFSTLKKTGILSLLRLTQISPK